MIEQEKFAKKIFQILKRGKAPNDYEKQLFNDHFTRVESVLKGEFPPPYEVEIQPTSICNLRCSHCFGNALTCNKIPNKIGLSEMKKIASEINDFELNGFNIETAKFCGTTGEPLVNPITVYGIKLFKDYGKKVIIYTNGLFLDKLTCENREYMDYCLEADKVNISLDAASRQTFSNIKRVDGFTRTLENVKNLVKKRDLSESKLRVDLSYVIGTSNYLEVESAAKIASEIGVNNILFRVDFTAPDKIREISKPIIEERKKAESYSRDNFKVIFAYSDDEITSGQEAFSTKGKKCYNHNFWACIGPNAELYSCGHRTYQEVDSFGSLLENRLRDLWVSEKRVLAVSRLPDEKCKFCSPSCTRRDCLMNALQKAPLSLVKQVHDKYTAKAA